jgi:hypothetical protein
MTPDRSGSGLTEASYNWFETGPMGVASLGRETRHA